MSNLAPFKGAAIKPSGGFLVPAPAATIEVRRKDTGALASIFSDEAGTTPITNPSAFADANANFAFYAAGLERGYLVTVTDGAFTLTVHIMLGTAGQFDATTFTGTFLDDASAPAARLTLGFPAVVAKGDLFPGSAADTLARLAAGSDGYPLVPSSGATNGLVYAPPGLGYNLVGGYLDWTVAGNVLTVAVKTWSGNAPSDAEPVFIPFRSATVATGSLVYRKLVAATSIAINDTALLGTVNSVAFRLWCVAFDDGGTVRLAIINCVSTTAGAGAGRDVTSIYPLKGWGIASATLEDNASDAAQIFYSSGAAVTAKAYATLGYATWESGLATAGTWSAGPTRAQLWRGGVPLPGDIIQMQRTDTGAVATGTTTIPFDDTIPQSTEGDQYMTQAITPASAANALRVKSQAIFSQATGAAIVLAGALFQDATANALTTFQTVSAGNDFEAAILIEKLLLAGGSVSTTFKTRVGASGAGTLTFNGRGSARKYGGTVNSYMQVEELMG